MIKNYYSSKNQEGFYSQKSDPAKNCWRYRFLSVFLPMFFLLIGELANAQVSINETFAGSVTPTGWSYTGFSRSTSLSCSDGALRRNFYSAGTASGTIQTTAWASSGQNLAISFDYKILDYDTEAGLSNTPDWGTLKTEVSIDGGTTYSIVAGTISGSNHVVSSSCATVNYTIPGSSLPSGNNLKVRISGAWNSASGKDYWMVVDNVKLTQASLTPPNCATALLPAAAATGIARNATLSWTAATGAPTSYDVYLGTATSPAFVANVTGTSYTPAVFTANTVYYWKVVAKNANGSAVGCAEQSFTTGTSVIYCTSAPTSNDNSGVTNVTINGTSLPIADVYYSDQTASVIDIYGGTTVPASVTFATGYAYGTNIWIDLNDNGTFETTELMFSGESLATNPTTFDTSFALAGSAVAGQHRMRIGTADSGQQPPNACYSGTYGVTIDLTVNVIAATLCVGTPDAGAVSRTTTSVCSGGAIPAISVTGVTTGVSGLQLQWEQSTDAGASYVNAVGGSGATTMTYTPPVFGGSNIQYRLKVTCSASGLFDYSDVSSVSGPTVPSTQASAVTVVSGLSSATISWTNGNGNRRHVVVNTTNSFTDPVGTADVAAASTTYTSGEQIVYNGTGNSVTVTGLTNGTYYVRVYENFRCTGTPNTNYYNVSTATDNPKSFIIDSNDACANAKVIACNDVTTTSLVGSTNENQAVCGISGVTTQNSGGIWYKFIGTGGEITVSTGQTVASVDTRLAVFSGACGTLTCIGGNDDINTSASNYRSEVLFSSTLSTEYYILLYSYSATTPTDAITLSITCAAPCAPATSNDECSAPVAVTIGTPLTTNNTCSSPSSGVAYPSTGSSFGTYYDSWYTFNSGANTALSFTTTSTTPTVVGYAVYTGACGTLTQVSGSSNLTGTKVTLTGLTANTDYLVRAFSTTPASRGTFTLSVALPTTTIATADCGTTKQEVGYESIDAVAVTGAEDYEFKIVNGSFSATVVSPDASVFFSEFAGFQYGTTYDVSVRAKFAGVYGEYGATCQVSTTATPTTEMQFCDETLAAVNSKVYFKGVPLATAYRYEVTNKTSLAVVITESANRYFYMNTLSNFSYGTEFSVRAQVQVNGTYHPYGDACDVTTPAAPTQLRAAYCGITLATITTNVYANYVTGATAYRFKATNGATVQEYTTTTSEPKFAISMLNEALLNTTYSIQVAAQVGGVWSPYGAACNVTTPASAPLTKLRDAYCGATLSAINTNVYASYVTGATEYRFRITNGANVQTIDVTEPKFMFTSLGSYDLGTTYTVDVASFVNGTWGAYGAACNVTTPAAPLTKLRDAYCGVTLNALNSNIYAKSMVGATGFRFKVSNGTAEEVYETTGMLFRLTYLTTIVPQNGTTYSISVSYNNGTAWSAYGDICSVTTPTPPVARPSVDNSVVSSEKLQVKAYPNPFTNDFTVGLNLVSELSSEIYIYDMTGKMIERKVLDANQLEKSGLGSNLPTGVYNVQIIQGNQVYNLKVMKN
ncbi:GEVED domain-containing protein [Flavobacterium sp. PLA-1-15]|uniref:GEVED domain-containing protein n=1 Tax=Flavobacterium sp. PLA-1-15 TaxID=3380533 RepID=UPI003B81C1FA